MVLTIVYDPSHAPELTSMWSDLLVDRPESEMTGVSFTYGGYAHMPNAPKGTGGYQVWEPDHWVFDSVEATIGSDLGAEDVTVAYECDGCPIEIIDGVPKPIKSRVPMVSHGEFAANIRSTKIASRIPGGS